MRRVGGIETFHLCVHVQKSEDQREKMNCAGLLSWSIKSKKQKQEFPTMTRIFTRKVLGYHIGQLEKEFKGVAALTHFWNRKSEDKSMIGQ